MSSAFLYRLRYLGVAVLSVVLALTLTLLMRSLLAPTLLPFFFVAVIFSTWLGGLESGLLASLLATLASRYFLMSPPYSLQVNSAMVIELVVLTLVVCLIHSLGDHLKLVRHHHRANLIKLHQSNTRFRAAAESSFDAIYILESVRDRYGTIIDFRFVELNEQGAKLISHTKAEVLQKRLCELLPINRTHGFFDKYKQVVETGVPLDEEFCTRGMPGVRATWIRHQIVPVNDGIAITSRDISAQKQAEVALQESEARFRRVLESNMIGMGFWDSNGEIRLANRALLTILGYESDNVGDRHLKWTAITPPEYVALDEQALQQIAESGYCQPYEKKFIRQDGSHVPVLCGAAAFEHTQDSGVFFVIDLTQYKQTEIERDRLLKLERTARSEAEAANRVKDEFLAVLSHELRTPLNPILGWTRLLRFRRLSEAQAAHAIEIIERNAQLQAQLVEDLLDISQILQGKLQFTCQPVDVIETVEAALETVSLSAAAKSITLHTQFERPVGTVLGNAGRLQQVFWNLLSNAIKFTPNEGLVEIQIQAIAGFVHVQLRDNGRGIAADFLPYVFDYFRQSDSGTTRSIGGLGLGLAIARYLVELHGGTIHAESTGLGQGSTFTVRLPLMVTDEPKQLPWSEPLSPALRDTLLTGLCILVVQEDPDLRDLMTFALEQAGAEVIATASIGETVRALVQTTPQPTVLIGDLQLPDEDGYTLMQQLRLLEPEKLNRLLTIALTPPDQDLPPQRTLTAGYQRYFAKPLDPTELVMAIATLTHRY